MPILSGENATKHIRHIYHGMEISRKNQPTIVAVTGHIEKDFTKKAIQNGFDQVLTKPLRIKELAELLFRMKFIDGIPQNLGNKSDDDYQNE